MNFEQSIIDFINIVKKNDKHQTLLIDIRLRSMFLTLLQFAQDTKLHDTDMQEIATYLENHFSENITLDDLSHKFCLSKYHLVREYKKAIGFSPIDHLLKIRIEQAKMLLHSTDIPSYIIGQNVGFSTEANFIRMFKSKEGVTPGNYREMFK